MPLHVCGNFRLWHYQQVRVGVWSTPFLQKTEQTVLSRSHVLFFKRILGLPVYE